MGFETHLLPPNPIILLFKGFILGLGCLSNHIYSVQSIYIIAVEFKASITMSEKLVLLGS